MKKNILIIADSYPPEIRSAAQLMKDLADGLNQRGHQVWVATSYPRYNLTAATETSWPTIKNENGIKVIRIKTLPHHKVNFLIRGIAQILMPSIFFREIKKNIKDKIEVVIVHSPPLPLTRAAFQLKKYFGAKFILNLHDFFPQNAIDLGILKNKIIIKFFEKMEKNAYLGADAIVVPSKSHKKYLIEKKGVVESKISVVYHWLDLEPFLKAQRTHKFRKLYNLEDKFIFLFAGVIGPSQGLELIVKVAEKLKNNPEIVFLLVGDGSAKKDLMKMAEDLQLKNVIFQPFVSLEEYPELVKDCDVGIISLTAKNTTPTVPAKLTGYLAAGLPVVAFLHAQSDGGEIIQEAQCGYVVRAGDLDQALKIIQKIYQEKDKLKELGTNGLNYALTHFTVENCVNNFEKLF